jgi:biotin transport system permease protein
MDSVILMGLLISSRLPLNRFFQDLKTWGIFILALFFFQSLFTPGDRLSGFKWLPLTREGLELAGLASWRLVLVLGYAVLFTAVTRPRELQDALIWFLKPVPLLPERRIGLMVSLTLRFFSLILDQIEEVRLAHRARLGHQNRNPLRKVKFLSLPLLRRSFSRVEDVTLALAARGYDDDIPVQLARIPRAHLIPVIILGFMVVFGSIF